MTSASVFTEKKPQVSNLLRTPTTHQATSAITGLFESGQDLLELTKAIGTATAVELPQLSQRVRDLGRGMLGLGLGPAQLTQFVASLNERITRRAVRLEFEGIGAPSEFCWLAFGSQARHEQTFYTDQDNGILFFDDSDPENRKQRLLPAARRVNTLLNDCGFALCPGDIMAGNARWCLSAGQWRQQFEKWIAGPDPQALLHGSIFFDFRAIRGDDQNVNELRTWLFKRIAQQPLFLQFMARNALQNRPPIGALRRLRRRLKGQNPDVLDIKINGASLLTDIGRIFALAAGVHATGTETRLVNGGDVLRIETDRIAAWQQAFAHLQSMRLRLQEVQLANGLPMSNQLNTAELNAFERSGLFAALHQTEDAQSALARHFRID